MGADHASIRREVAKTLAQTPNGVISRQALRAMFPEGETRRALSSSKSRGSLVSSRLREVLAEFHYKGWIARLPDHVRVVNAAALEKLGDSGGS